jgi:hypothetical protein
MIKVFHNSNGSGDWIHIKEGDETIFEGHRVGVHDLVFLLERYANVKLFELTDEEMEEGEFQ